MKYNDQKKSTVFTIFEDPLKAVAGRFNFFSSWGLVGAVGSEVLLVLPPPPNGDALFSVFFEWDSN